MAFLFIYSIHLAEIEFKFMTVDIKYKNSTSTQKSSNLVLFVDEKFSIFALKKHILSS